jgi:hypothetical protein
VTLNRPGHGWHCRRCQWFRHRLSPALSWGHAMQRMLGSPEA